MYIHTQGTWKHRYRKTGHCDISAPHTHPATEVSAPHIVTLVFKLTEVVHIVARRKFTQVAVWAVHPDVAVLVEK